MEARRRAATDKRSFQVSHLPFARIIFDTAGCGRRQGSSLRSDRSRGKALTAVLAVPTMQPSGRREKEKWASSPKNT